MNTKTLDTQIQNALITADNNFGELILITGGPTCEDIDAVRFITNHSTGKMGIECAYAAKKNNLSPILILGPTHLKIEDDTIPVINIRSAAELYYTVDNIFTHAKYLIMSAAVADFTPVYTSNDKLKKAAIENENHEFTLQLKRTVDILKNLQNKPERSNKLIAGFSLDTNINLTEGLRKLSEKNLDVILINSTDAFAKEKSSVVIITKDKQEIKLENADKRYSASKIIEQLFRLEKSL